MRFDQIIWSADGKLLGSACFPSSAIRLSMEVRTMLSANGTHAQWTLSSDCFGTFVELAMITSLVGWRFQIFHCLKNLIDQFPALDRRSYSQSWWGSWSRGNACGKADRVRQVFLLDQLAWVLWAHLGVDFQRSRLFTDSGRACFSSASFPNQINRNICLFKKPSPFPLITHFSPQKTAFHHG